MATPSLKYLRGFSVSAATADTPIAAFEDATGKLAGVQFHPRSVCIQNTVKQSCRIGLLTLQGAFHRGQLQNIADEEVAKAKAAIGDKRVICGLSGGVDSAVAAAIVQKASWKSTYLRICRSRFIAQRRV